MGTITLRISAEGIGLDPGWRKPVLEYVPIRTVCVYWGTPSRYTLIHDSSANMTLGPSLRAAKEYLYDEVLALVALDTGMPNP